MNRTNRRARRTDRCQCGRPAEVVFITVASERIPWCGDTNEAARPHCPFCGAAVALDCVEGRR